MYFVEKNPDVFLFYEKSIPKQVYINADVLNSQIKDLIENDVNINNNINYLFNLLNTLYENKPLDLLNEAMEDYYDTSYKKDFNFDKIWLDFGTIKSWIGDEE